MNIFIILTRTEGCWLKKFNQQTLVELSQNSSLLLYQGLRLLKYQVTLVEGLQYIFEEYAVRSSILGLEEFFAPTCAFCL